MPTDLTLDIDQRSDDVIGNHLFVVVGAVEHDIDSKAGSVPGRVVADGADSAPSEFRYDTLQSTHDFRDRGTLSVGWVIGIGHINLLSAELLSGG